MAVRRTTNTLCPCVSGVADDDRAHFRRSLCLARRIAVRNWAGGAGIAIQSVGISDRPKVSCAVAQRRAADAARRAEPRDARGEGAPHVPSSRRRPLTVYNPSGFPIDRKFLALSLNGEPLM